MLNFATRGNESSSQSATGCEKLTAEVAEITLSSLRKPERFDFASGTFSYRRFITSNLGSVISSMA